MLESLGAAGPDEDQQAATADEADATAEGGDGGYDDAARPRALGTWARWRAPLVLVPLVVCVGVAGGVGARLLWADVDRGVATPEVTCWDGRVAPTAEECGAPEGAAGLKWVFPGFRPHGGRCEQVHRPDTGQPRALEFTCRHRVAGEPVTVVYSQRTTLQRGLQYIEKTYPGVEPEESATGDRLTYRAERPRGGRHVLTVAYAHHPYAVDVRAPSAAVRDQALRKLVRFRPVEHLGVRPPSATRAPATPA